MKFAVFLVTGLIGVLLTQPGNADDSGKAEKSEFEEIKNIIGIAKKFHETVGEGNITRTILIGKKAYDKKKQVDKFLGKKEESPLKTVESVLKIGQKLGGR